MITELGQGILIRWSIRAYRHRVQALLGIDIRATVLARGVLRVPLHLHYSDYQAIGRVTRWAGRGETFWSQDHLPVLVRVPGFVPHCQVGHDVNVVRQGGNLLLGDFSLVPAEGAGDAACTVSNIQDFNEAAGADSVQAVQDFRLSVVDIVALITDFTF